MNSSSRLGSGDIGAGSLLGQQQAVDVGEHTTLGDCDASQQLVQLLVIAHSELDVAGVDTVLLVVTGSIASQLKDLSGKILEDGSEVDGSAGTNTGSIVAFAKMAMNTTNGKLQSCARGARLALAGGGLSLSSLSTTRSSSGGCGGHY